MQQDEAKSDDTQKRVFLHAPGNAIVDKECGRWVLGAQMLEEHRMKMGRDAKDVQWHGVFSNGDVLLWQLEKGPYTRCGGCSVSDWRNTHSNHDACGTWRGSLSVEQGTAEGKRSGHRFPRCQAHESSSTNPKSPSLPGFAEGLQWGRGVFIGVQHLDRGAYRGAVPRLKLLTTFRRAQKSCRPHRGAASSPC